MNKAELIKFYMDIGMTEEEATHIVNAMETELDEDEEESEKRMSDTVKLIVTLSKGQYENLKNIQCGSIGSRMIVNAVMNGIPLDDVKAEFINSYPKNFAGEPELGGYACDFSLNKVLKILDNIGKESEVKPNEM